MASSDDLNAADADPIGPDDYRPLVREADGYLLSFLSEASPKESANLLERYVPELKRRIREWEPLLRGTGSPEAASLEERLGKRVSALSTLQNLLRQCHPARAPVVLERFDTVEMLLEPHPNDAFVMSIDIRRSTDLMLMATTPSAFAAFIAEAGAGLRKVVQEHDGLADKFTGDGILAWFPLFLTGLPTYDPTEEKHYEGADSNTAALKVLAAARECHLEFQRCYRRHAAGFTRLDPDAGLGIGIDFGEIHTAAISETPTIIGRPVVWACRLNSAPAHHTWVNNQAEPHLSPHAPLEERIQDLKNVGRTVVWQLAPTLGPTAVTP